MIHFGHPRNKFAMMTLLLKRFDPALGFEFWQQLTSPDLYRVTFGAGATVRRIALDCL